MEVDTMNILLIFFALPIAVIIISAILQKLLKNPIAVAAFIFAIFLIVTFAAFDETFLIATLAYTLLALITALIVKFICETNNDDDDICELLRDILKNNNICELLRNILRDRNRDRDRDRDNNNDTICDILNCNNSNNSNSNNNNSCGCSCNRYRRF